MADEHVISQDVRSGTKPDRNLALELVRVTESGAMAAGRWVGRGDKEAGDGAAVDAMHQLVRTQVEEAQRNQWLGDVAPDAGFSEPICKPFGTYLTVTHDGWGGCRAPWVAGYLVVRISVERWIGVEHHLHGLRLRHGRPPKC